MKTPEQIVAIMLEGDAFSRWMQVKVEQLSRGQCTLSCVVREEMLNGHRIAHGGISYALADSALAFAANSYGFKCVSIETSISHLRPVQENDTLTCVCEEVHRGKTFAIYKANIYDQNNLIVASFKGSVNISIDKW
jgi:acyl-CoA thioesterase